MTKKEYSELLKSPEWATKRAYIFKRDRYVCAFCGSKKDIQVHHKYYIKGRKPWEYRNSALITLCRECHEAQHKDKHISKFVRKTGKAKKPKDKRMTDKLYFTLSKKDLALQRKIDGLRAKGVI